MIPLSVPPVFEPADEGTRISLTLEWRAAGPLRLVEPLLARAAKWQPRSEYARLKELLESRA